MKKPKVSIVLLNFNNEHHTIGCLDSLARLAYPDFEVIVVENGSTEEHKQKLKDHISHLKGRLNIILLEEEKNQGFAEGNNIGARAASGRYVVLLNNDTVVDKDYLSEMVRMIESGDKIAIVGSRINNIEAFYGTVETLGNVISLMGEPVNIWEKDNTFTFMASGCSLLFRKDILPEPFDGDYFMYGEDTYAAWLVRLKGYDVKIAPDSRLDHLGGQVRIKASNLLEFHGEKNKIMNPLLFYSAGNAFKMLPIIFINVLMTIIVSTFKLRVHIRLKSYLWLLWNWRKILTKRKSVQAQRKVSDKALAPYITSKIPQKLGVLNKAIDLLLFAYCFAVRLPVKEIFK